MVLHRRRRTIRAVQLCMGILSWQMTICNCRRINPEIPFWGWKGFTGDRNSIEKLQRRPFLGWRGGSSHGNDNYYRQQQEYEYSSTQEQGSPEPPPDLPAPYSDHHSGPYPPPPPDHHSSQHHAYDPQSHSNPPPPDQYQEPPPPPPPPSYSEPSLPELPPGPPGEDESLPPPSSLDDPTAAMEADESRGLDPSLDDPFDGDNLSSNEPKIDLSAFDKEFIMKGLARLYRKKILPLELSSRYGHFHSPPLSPADFDAPPAVLLLGPFSVGKTSFIKYLLGRDFPGIRVGPEPTTDRFTAVLWGPDDKIIPGAALCAQNYRPFTGLSPFGNNFLSRMEGVELDSPVLRNVTLIDTPGILSGQKQRNRNYDYEAVMKWFAERADLIVIMFDAHKLDISDEMKRVLEIMIPHLDKIRIVLNKADIISTQQLMRVYGALMWSLGKVMNTPEVCRVYMGSFWDKPLHHTDQAELLQKEEMDLLHDIMGLPPQAVMRRINELVKRARSVKVHAYMIHYLRKQLPYNPWSRRDKQRRLIGRLEQEFLGAARRYGLPKGDFPALEPFRQALYEIKDLSDFPKLDKKLIKEMDKVFSVDIPELLERARNH